jgi:hypothetical protein
VAEQAVAEAVESAESVPPDTPLSEISDVVHRLPYSPADSLEPWCSEYQPVGTIDNYGVLAYEMEQITSPGNYADGYDMTSYDLPFADISEQTMSGIPEYL